MCYWGCNQGLFCGCYNYAINYNYYYYYHYHYYLGFASSTLLGGHTSAFSLLAAQ